MWCRGELPLWSGVLVLLLTGGPRAAADPGGPPESPGPGKSARGAAFDEGPRQAAVRLEGTGKVSFPVTTRSAEAQAFFNQGVGQLHGYWFTEAERSFRQAAALDRDCAMAYWGMAVANFNDDRRAAAFIKEAVKLKANATTREQEWIQALADYYSGPAGDEKGRRRGLVQAQEKLCYRYPDDLEAKAFLVWFLWDNNVNGVPLESSVAANAVADQVLAAEPMHPIHHFRIHLTPPEEAGSRGRLLASAEKCSRAAPDVPHMWHMPGHAYAALGRFADAAYHLEAALRVENAYLTRMKMMPREESLYVHNRDWLLDNLANVGRVREALELAKSMVELPRHPKFGQETAAEGRRRLLELGVRHELWSELLALETSDYFEPTTDPGEQVRRALAFGAAHFATGDRAGGEALLARLGDVKKQAQENRQDEILKQAEKAQSELMGYQALTAGNVARAITWFEAADSDSNELLARLYLQSRNAVKANELSNDVGGRVSRLAVRVEVLHGLGRREEARRAFDQLRRLAEKADLSLPALKRLQPIAREFGCPDDWRLPAATAEDRPELERLGPRFWQPWTAPAWKLSDIDGKTRSLDEFRGRPIVLICYLGVGCIHCVKQLQAFNKAAEKFGDAGIAIVAVGDDAVELMRRSRDGVDPDMKLPLVMLSDVKHDVFRAYGAFDDFEGKPLHGTFLIDSSGRVRWQDVGADPFMDTEFLLKESRRLLRQPEVRLGYGPQESAARLVPLTELTARYKGQDGGLYGEGRNAPPAEHLKRALDEVKRMRPLDRDGRPDVSGRIVLLGLGGEQAGEMFGRFKAKADRDADRAAEVVLVDGTQWDQDAASWADPANEAAWLTVGRRLSAAGVGERQVQAVWLDVGLASPSKAGAFPRHAEELREKLARIVVGLPERFPNLRVVWLSGGVYAGYAVEKADAEPFAYESAFAVRDVILEQARGSERLAQAPVLLWGPYLWADGATPRHADGLAWRREDFLADGQRLSASGREKGAEALLRFFKEDEAARGWFAKRPR